MIICHSLLQDICHNGPTEIIFLVDHKTTTHSYFEDSDCQLRTRPAYYFLFHLDYVKGNFSLSLSFCNFVLKYRKNSMKTKTRKE